MTTTEISSTPATPGRRPTRAEYALNLAEVVKTPAACTRRQVACVILDKNKRIAATGYNGTPAGAVHCTDGGCPRGRFTHDDIPPDLGNSGHEVACVARHAEENATEWALEHGADPATSLVAITCAPCAECGPMLRAQGWGEVVWPGGGWTLG
ncbi:deoxycytidylate deaminase [Nocardioides pakistanensis]